jgi:hypothetical protein
MSRLVDIVNNLGGIDAVRIKTKMFPLNTMFGISFTSSGDKPKEVLCKLDEKQYKFADKYKTTLVPEDEKYAYEHYYLCELDSMLRGHRRTMILCVCVNGEWVELNYEELLKGSSKWKELIIAIRFCKKKVKHIHAHVRFVELVNACILNL